MEILTSLNVVNLYRVMSMLKLKINVNLSQLMCIVVSVAQNGELERFHGFWTVFLHAEMTIHNNRGRLTFIFSFNIDNARYKAP